MKWRLYLGIAMVISPVILLIIGFTAADAPLMIVLRTIFVAIIAVPYGLSLIRKERQISRRKDDAERNTVARSG